MGLDELSYRVREPAGEPDGALILLHGRGADEHDLAPLFDLLDPSGRLLGACPRGPLSLPPGGAHWYVVRRVGYPDPDTYGATFGRVQAWLDAFLDDAGIPIERTVIGGFSQGAVMSYSLALAAGRPRPAGLLAFSGFIPEVTGFEMTTDPLEGFPVAIGHGTYDPVIAVDFGRAAGARLQAAGADLTYRESPMAHGIDPGYLDTLQGWVGEVLPQIERKRSS